MFSVLNINFRFLLRYCTLQKKRILLACFFFLHNRCSLGETSDAGLAAFGIDTKSANKTYNQATTIVPHKYFPEPHIVDIEYKKNKQNSPL